MRGFSFKSKTNSGLLCRYEVHCYDEKKDVAIIKLILSKEDIKCGFQCIRQTKWGNLYMQVTTLKYNSIAAICHQIFEPLNPQSNERTK
jgi:hypothetical protein